jgi:hypothetical protein
VEVDLAAGRAHLVGQTDKPVAATGTGDYQMPLGGEVAGRGLADAAAGAADENDFPLGWAERIHSDPFVVEPAASLNMVISNTSDIVGSFELAVWPRAIAATGSPSRSMLTPTERHYISHSTHDRGNPYFRPIAVYSPSVLKASRSAAREVTPSLGKTR